MRRPARIRGPARDPRRGCDDDDGGDTMVEMIDSLDRELVEAFRTFTVIENPSHDWPGTRLQVLELMRTVRGEEEKRSTAVTRRDLTVPGGPENPTGVPVRVYEPRDRD